MSDIIRTVNLRKSFKKGRGQGGEVLAVKGVTFSVEKGEVFGLLGPNGAGKTTTMRMLSTLLTPTSGEVKVAGLDLSAGAEEIRRRIGYVSQAGGMLRDLSGRDNVIFQAKLYGMKQKEAEARADELVRLFHLEAYADRPVSTYSGGQKRIFDLASGIVHKPELLFLDEPSTGLDPQNRAHVWEQVKKLRDQGTSVFLTTHYLDEADALCNRIAIMDKGELMAEGTPEALKGKYEAKTLDEVFLKITGHIMWNPGA
ncbi:ATP-binding cassette domain-containing protein [Candidatus Parcubacteria bacterium]|nr:ATP-binding cassette domain-containing protein [Candidatus Parcubacteria bacterium]